MSDTKVTPTTFISAQVPTDLYDSFKAIADEADRSVSAELRRVLKAHVERKAEKAAANA